MIKWGVVPRIKPMALRLVSDPFDDPAFLFELKHDGFRAVCYIEDSTCRLVSRNMRNLQFEFLRSTLAKLPVQSAILGGEIICLDGRGVSQFNQLLTRKALNGEDWMQRPLIERKARLREIVRASGCERLLYAEHIEQHGKRFFEEICELDLEGIVAKRKMSIYKPGGNGWLKIKNKSYSQAEGRHELLTKRR